MEAYNVASKEYTRQSGPEFKQIQFVNSVIPIRSEVTWVRPAF